MRRLLPLLLLCAGCWPTAGEVPIHPIVGDDDDGGPVPGPECTLRDYDDSALPTAVLDAPYSGQVLIVDYDGGADFTLAQGTTPPGLELAADGAISGTPTELGVWDLWLRAEQDDGGSAFGCVQLEVRDLPKDVFLGYVHDQRTVLTNTQGVQQDLWMRVAGGGEGGMDTVLLRPGLYRPGPDGVDQQGGGDDELVRLIDPSEVDIEPGLWTNADAEPALDPTVYLGDGLFEAGIDTGTLPFTMTHPDFPPVESWVQVVPPDWCPEGISSGPGDGSCL